MSASWMLTVSSNGVAEHVIGHLLPLVHASLPILSATSDAARMNTGTALSYLSPLIHPMFFVNSARVRTNPAVTVLSTRGGLSCIILYVSRTSLGTLVSFRILLIWSSSRVSSFRSASFSASRYLRFVTMIFLALSVASSISF